jgi:hypothetical protein
MPMARSEAGLPAGTRLTDHISLGVLAKYFPQATVDRILSETGRGSVRTRLLPARVMTYYAIAMALHMSVGCREVLRCLLEGLVWLRGLTAALPPVATRGAIAQARERLGVEPVRRLYDEVVVPLAVRGPEGTTRGAWYRQWGLFSLDGSTLDVADTAANAATFGRPGASRGKSAYPQIRFVSLVENGTHALLGSRMGGYRSSEAELTEELLPLLKPGMLCLADRNFFSYERWQTARQTGADLLWRVKKNLKLPCLRRLADGSYLSKIYPSDKARRHDEQGVEVRVIEYELVDDPDAEPRYRLLTTILDPAQAPADELAALYHERWEIETALDEFKTHLRGAQIVLRSKAPDLVRQEFYGFMMAHYAVRGLMHEAALKADVDPDRLSFTHTVRVIRRKAPQAGAVPPSGPATLASEGA